MDRREFIEKVIAAASLPVVPSLLPIHESDGERNERLFLEAQQLIQTLSQQPLNAAVVRKAIDEVNAIGEWGHCAVYSGFFSKNTRQLAASVMTEDCESYHEYWSLLTEESVHKTMFSGSVTNFGPLVQAPFTKAYHNRTSCKPTLQEFAKQLDNLLFYDAILRIENSAIDFNNGHVIEATIESVPPQYEWGQAAYDFCLFSSDQNTRTLAVHCMVTEYQSFREYLPQLPRLLDHHDWQVKIVIPRLLWRFGVDARLAIPRLQDCLSDDDPWFRIVSAKAIAVIEPLMRQQMISVVEPEMGHPECGQFFRNVLAELRGEKPYLGL